MSGSLNDDQRRDRRLAKQPHYGPRKAAAVSDLVNQWMKSPQVRRLKKHSHLTAALEEVLPPGTCQGVSTALVWQCMTLAVQSSAHLPKFVSL